MLNDRDFFKFLVKGGWTVVLPHQGLQVLCPSVKYAFLPRTGYRRFDSQVEHGPASQMQSRGSLGTNQVCLPGGQSPYPRRPWKAHCTEAS